MCLPGVVAAADFKPHAFVGFYGDEDATPGGEVSCPGRFLHARVEELDVLGSVGWQCICCARTQLERKLEGGACIFHCH
jgi:hypothetical protein